MRPERRGDRKVEPASAPDPSAAPSSAASPRDRRAAVESWFARRGWTIFPFQRETWRLIAERRSGLVHATTGSGKTLAVALGAWLSPHADAGDEERLSVLWVTPMRALAADTERSLREAFAAVSENDASATSAWRVGARTGDTSESRGGRWVEIPRVLVTTPESLSLMLTQDDARESFGALSCIVVDEWHELLGSKRGVQTQLALARLRRFSPGVLTWGLSATLGNLEEAKRTLLGPRAATAGALVEGRLDKPLIIDTLLPKTPERFPWAGHLGGKMAEAVVGEIEAASTTLVFTNTRSQAELWYQNILRLRPEWAGILAVHHGSLSRETRDWVEQGLKAGSLKAVVCTSSLDLGVDFLPVERVLQIGSPKGVARLLQRAGRSGHAPGRVSRSRSFPLTRSNWSRQPPCATQSRRAGSRAEGASMRRWMFWRSTASRWRSEAAFGQPTCLRKCARLRRTNALPTKTGRWVLDFVRRGGPSLTAYPGFRRIGPDADGIMALRPIGSFRRGTSSTSVRSSAMRQSWFSMGRHREGPSSAQLKRALSPV